MQVYRLGLGWLLVGVAPVLILSTREDGAHAPRHTALEYRRHGTKFYVFSLSGQRPAWTQALMAEPHATVNVGGQLHHVRAIPVRDPSEVLRVLYMFRQKMPFLFVPLTPWLKRLHLFSPANLRDLELRAPQVAIMRLEIQDAPLVIPPVSSDRAWWWAVLVGVALLASIIEEWRGRNLTP